MKNPDDRRDSLKNLSESKEKEATVALLYALTDPDIACRKIAIEALKNRPELSNLNLDRLVQLAENQEQLEIE